MASAVLLLTIFSTYFVFIQALGTNGIETSCIAYCDDENNFDKNFLERTSPCASGCSTYSIIYLARRIIPVKDGEQIDDIIKDRCYSSCNEAYEKKKDVVGDCHIGCDKFAEFKDEEAKKQIEATENATGIHFLRPVMQVRRVYSSFEGLFHIIRSSVMTYFVQDDNKLIRIESEPEIIVEMIPEGLEGLEKEAELAANELLVGHSQPRSRIESLDGNPKKVKYVESFFDVDETSYITLIILSTFIILLSTMILSVLRVKARQTRLNKEGNLKLPFSVEKGPLPVTVVRPEDLTKLSLMEDEEGQAPPLPNKVKMPDSTKV